MFFFNNSFGRFRKQIFVLNENIEIKYIERLFYTSGSILAQGKLLDQSGLGLLCYAACENNDSDVRIYNWLLIVFVLTNFGLIICQRLTQRQIPRRILGTIIITDYVNSISKFLGKRSGMNLPPLYKVEYYPSLYFRATNPKELSYFELTV